MICNLKLQFQACLPMFPRAPVKLICFMTTIFSAGCDFQMADKFNNHLHLDRCPDVLLALIFDGTANNNSLFRLNVLGRDITVCTVEDHGVLKIRRCLRLHEPQQADIAVACTQTFQSCTCRTMTSIQFRIFFTSQNAWGYGWSLGVCD